MPAAPVHHTPIDPTNSWDGPAEEKAFDKVKGDFVKFYAWVDEGETDPDADGTDKEDGWGPHHDVDEKGVPGAANLKGVEATMAVLNGARGGDAVIPSGDRQAVWDHLAAHYKDAGIKAADIPELKSAPTSGVFRDATPVEPGDVTDDPNASDGTGPNMPQVGDASHDDCVAGGFMNVEGAVTCAQCGADLDNVDDDAGNAVEQNESADAEATSAEEVANDGSRSGPPRENLVRARYGTGIAVRDDSDAPGTGSLLYGHFSVFNDWYEIDSYWEGTFLESIAPGAFAQTMVEDIASMRVLYDHGFDPVLGNKPLGPITALREDDMGAYYEVPLLDTDYNRDFVLPALQGRLMTGQAVGSQLGASFRFIVLAENWTQKPDPSDFNQLGLPQRVITQAKVLEFGPVTFPANQGASSGVRSCTDSFVSRLRSDPLSLARFTERTSAKVVEQILAMPPSTMRRGTSNTTQSTSDDVQAEARTRSFNLRARLALADN